MPMRPSLHSPPFSRAARVFGALALLAACVTEDVDPDGAAGGPDGDAGGAGASAGGASGGSSSGAGATGGAGEGVNPYADDPSFGMGARCPPITQALIIDFTSSAPAAPPDAGGDAAPPPAPIADSASFGDFTSTFSGSTFVYPGVGTAYPVTSDVSMNDWHLSGSLGDYSGFGIAFANCYLVDASAYDGIAFTISGSVPMGDSITLNVGTAANDVSHVWLNATNMPDPMLPANAGRCIPAASQYDGSCGAPNVTVPVTAAPTTVEVTWAELTGGQPASTVNPAEITSLSWNFPAPPGAGTATPTPYDVDVVIDDLRFLGGP